MVKNVLLFSCFVPVYGSLANEDHEQAGPEAEAEKGAADQNNATR